MEDGPETIPSSTPRSPRRVVLTRRIGGPLERPEGLKDSVFQSPPRVIKRTDRRRTHYDVDEDETYRVNLLVTRSISQLLKTTTKGMDRHDEPVLIIVLV